MLSNTMSSQNHVILSTQVLTSISYRVKKVVEKDILTPFVERAIIVSSNHVTLN